MYKRKIITLACISIVLIAIYLFYSTGTDIAYVLPNRIIKVVTIILVSFCIGFSSLLFQTLTANKILTPAIMGFESVYMFLQTLIVYMYGDKTFSVVNHTENFFLSIVFMILFAMLIYVIIFKKENNNIYFMLLVGLILGTLLNSLSSFMQLVIDPNEFAIVEGRMFASFNRINTDLLSIALIIAAATLLYSYRNLKYLDAISLGKNVAINLGISYNAVVRKYLIIISILVSISTALVGPITFLGLLVTNLTYELFKTYKHSVLIPACCLVAVISVTTGQFLVEHIFNFSTTISIIINFIGGVYFLFLLIKINKSW